MIIFEISEIFPVDIVKSNFFANISWICDDLRLGLDKTVSTIKFMCVSLNFGCAPGGFPGIPLDTLTILFGETPKLRI